MTADQDPKIAEAASESAWPKLTARMMEDITRAELQRFETSLAGAFRTAADRVFASVFRIASKVIGAACFVAALVLFLGQWLPWWLSFAVAGLTIVAGGEIVYNRDRKSATFDRAQG